MSGIATRQQDLQAEYEAIELAVKETERGRWFLNEYARRNRHADTEMLLTALSRIERSVGIHADATHSDNLRQDILEMSEAIARTRIEIAAIRPPDAETSPIVEASGELSSIVTTTESATSSILSAAEQVQAAAWTLREGNADKALCDSLDSRATEIYLACSFQDLTAQRTRKVIDTLTFIEQRLAAMAAIWQAPENSGAAAPADTAAGKPATDARPMRGIYANAMSQDDVDSVLLANAEVALADMAAIDEILFTEPPASPPPLPAEATRLQLVSSQDMPEPPAPKAAAEEHVAIDETLRKVKAGDTLSSDEAAKALDVLQGLSVEERARLFS